MDKQSRAGLYIEKDTRHRLNLFKARYALEHGRFVNQSEAIDALLDLAGIPGSGAQPEALPLFELRTEHAAL